MKKIARFLCMALAMAALAACGGAKAGPDSAVKSFSEAMKKFDPETMSSCMVDPSDMGNDLTGDLDDEMSAQLFDYFKQEAGKITYEIKSSESDDTSGTVVAAYKYTDTTPVISEALGEYITTAFAMAFSGASEEEMNAKFQEIFDEKVKSVETKTAEKEVTFKCEKVGKDWKIKSVDNKENLGNIITCNMLQAFSSIGDAFGGSDNSGNSSASANSGAASSASKAPKELTYEKMEIDGGIFKGVFGTPMVSAYAKIKNTSDCAIKFTDAYFDYEDKDGHLLGSDNMIQCVPEALKPGEIGYLYSYYHDLGDMDTPNGFQVNVHFKAQEAKNLTTIDVGEVIFKTGGFMDVEVTARATNNTGKDLSYSEPCAIFYNAADEIMGFCYGIEDFPAGETKTFSISGDLLSADYDPKDVTRVEVIIQEDPWF